MRARPTSVLVVEDNRDLALGLRVNLSDEGYAVETASTAREALAAVRRSKPDLILLDLGLPDGDGVDFLRRLRADGEDALVLVLTASVQHDRKLQALRDGADDYVTKPFDLDELLARVQVLLRRRATLPAAAADETADETAERYLTSGDLAIDLATRVARRGGVALELSRIAFDLLVALVRRRGAVATRQELLREVWGYHESVTSRTLDTHIFELRRLIEVDPRAPVRIRTVWRIGYRME